MNAMLKHFWEQIYTCIRNLSLRGKIFLIIIINVLILLLSSLLGFYILTGSYNELLYRSIAGNLSFSSHTLYTNLQDVERLSTILMSNPAIQDSLSSIHDSTDAVMWSNANRQINTSLLSYYEAYKKSGVSYIVLLNNHFTNTTNWAAYRRTNSEFVDLALQNTEAADGATSWTLNTNNTSGIFLGRNIRKIEGLDFSTLGQLLVYVDINQLVTEINRSFQTYETSYYILADASRPIYASETLSSGMVESALGQAVQDYQTIRLEEHTYFAVNGTIPGYNWRYLNLIPFDDITSSQNHSVKTVFLIMLLGILTALGLAQLLIYSIIRHFNALIFKIDAFSRNELTTEQPAYNYNLRKDEIGRLHQRFDRMTHRIRTLVDTNYKNEILRKEAQLKTLESQINPHFLYNTLESINWRAKASQNMEISQMVESLGKLLRTTLSNQNSLVTLNYELELIQAYMTIQQIRFEDRLDFTIEAEKKLKKILLPPLTLQPLIENAILYGMENSTETCHIQVQVLQMEQLIVIRVSNSGSSFEEDLLEKLRRRDKQTSGFGIGLLNIDERIRLLFGSPCGLFLRNENDWAIADIYIPYQIKEETGYAENDYC